MHRNTNQHRTSPWPIANQLTFSQAFSVPPTLRTRTTVPSLPTQEPASSPTWSRTDVNDWGNSPRTPTSATLHDKSTYLVILFESAGCFFAPSAQPSPSAGHSETETETSSQSNHPLLLHQNHRDLASEIRLTRSG